MGKTVRNLFILMLIAASISLGVAVASAGDTVLSWPQSFSVESDEKAEFGFPVTQPGQVVIDVRWQGPALSVELRDSNGNPVASASPAQAPTAKLTYDLTTADVQRGILWTVSISASTQASSRASSSSRAPAAARPLAPARPQSSARPQAASPVSSLVISGEVSVQHPAFDQRLVDANLQAVKTQRAALKGSPPPPRMLQEISGATQARIAAFEKAESDRFAALEKQALAKFDAAKGPALGRQTKSTAVPPGRKPGTVPVTGTTSTGSRGNPVVGGGKGKPQIGQAQNPVLVSVTPASGSPGERVHVTVANVKADIYSTDIWFLIGSGMWVEANMFSATPGSNGEVDFEAEVPNAAGATQVFDGQVYAQYKENVPPSKTNELPFRFTVGGPIIDQVTPAEGVSGDWVTLEGQGFKADSEVYFVIPQKTGAEKVRSQYKSSTRLDAQIPWYSAKETTAATMYARGKNARGSWVLSNEQAITLRPNAITVNSVFPTEVEPGTLLVLTGSGFPQEGYIEYLIPGNVGQAMDRSVRYNETQAITRVPEGIGGVRETVNALLLIFSNNGGKSDLIPFRFKPAIETKVLNVSSIPNFDLEVSFVYDDTYDFYCVDDSTSIRGHHTGGIVTGSRGDDEYFTNFRLKNGWVVDSVQFSKDVEYGEAGANIAETRIGTDSPYVKVHWYTTPNTDSATYSFSITIKGPRGVPYL